MSMETLKSGTGEFRCTDPDVIRVWMRDHKRRDFVDKTSTEAETVSRFVQDGDDVRKIIHQGRRNLWDCAQFTLMEHRTIIGRTAKG